MKEVNLKIQAINDILAANPRSESELSALKRTAAKKYGLPTLLNSEILKEYRGQKLSNVALEKVLRKRSIRTMSGVAPVAVLTKPYPCPGNCAYCPNEKNVPVSYLSSEPAVMRAIRCQYDPYKQTVLRLKALEMNGHEPNKIEIIVIGGTFSYLPIKYKYWYILNCFKAANDYQHLRKNLVLAKIDSPLKIKAPIKQNLSLDILKKLLKLEQSKNEKATYRIIGLTLETRPDYIDEQEALLMRELGATRVELGVQALDDDILKLNHRGHGVKETAEATKLLKDYGFKITYHFMPALPGSNPAKDLKMFKELFSSPQYCPDQLKFYPTIVTKGSLLYRWYRAGKYQPYSDKQLQRLITQCKAITPEYVRIIRLIRDIPGEDIVAGNLITNLRQIMKDQGVKCRCIRCREARGKTIDQNFQFRVTEYPASLGREYFIQVESADRQTLYGFCRLRLTDNSPIAPAIIRELHVYGELVPVGSKKVIQHAGLGKSLLSYAEDIARQAGVFKMAIISGVGVRAYYRKLGYKLKNGYMFKEID